MKKLILFLPLFGIVLNSFGQPSGTGRTVDLDKTYIDSSWQSITITDSLILENLASDNLVVLSPTSTGAIDTTETTDLATEDFTVTGDWTFDNVVADSIEVDSIHVSGFASFDNDIEVNGFIYPYESIHIFAGFQDSAVVIDLTQSSYSQITNLANDLWTVTDENDATISGDTLILATAGNYWGTYSVTFDGSIASYRFRVYNVTDAAEEGFAVHATGWGAGNYTVITKPLYFKDCTAGDRFVMQVTNLDGNEDATFVDGAIVVNYLEK